MTNHDLTTPEGVRAHMKNSATAKEWNANCNDVKKANNGGYPAFWFEEIVLSGFASIVTASFD